MPGLAVGTRWKTKRHFRARALEGLDVGDGRRAYWRDTRDENEELNVLH